MSIIVKGISKVFTRKNCKDEFTAIDNINLSIDKGIFLAITGKSGSGKTTLLNIISGLLTPTSGEVLFNNSSLYNLTDSELANVRNRNFGIIPQGYSAISSLSVIDNIKLPALINKPDTDELNNKAKELMNLVGIAHLADSSPDELSGGEHRRMCIARALIQDPEFIFADEPTGDLDVENTKIVLDLLKKIANSGKAVVIVTHELNIEQYVHRTLSISNGVFE